MLFKFDVVVDVAVVEARFTVAMSRPAIVGNEALGSSVQ
jgi:hypothetical protein